MLFYIHRGGVIRCPPTSITLYSQKWMFYYSAIWNVKHGNFCNVRGVILWSRRWMQIEEHFPHRHVRIWAWMCFLHEIPPTPLRVHVQVRLPSHFQWCFQWRCEENATLACHCCCTLCCDTLVSSAKGLGTTRPNHTKACRRFLQSPSMSTKPPKPLLDS